MDHQSINLGRLRGIAQCASPDGVFCILALDHRQALLKEFAKFADKAFEESVAFKAEVIRSLSPYATAFLLDPVIGAAPAIANHALPGSTGLIVCVEETGYDGASHARVSRLPEFWNIEKIKRMGASAVKILIYDHPDAETAPAMRELLAQVSHDCNRCDIPLFLEILTYSVSREGEPLSGAQRQDAILRSVEELTPIGGDILKVEFPCDASANRRVCDDACKSITQASQIPWVLLSAGVDSNVFLEQTSVACTAGASGILAGRAIWKEALKLEGKERSSFLEKTAAQRMQELYKLCAATARPYFDKTLQAALDQNWQRAYPGFLN